MLSPLTPARWLRRVALIPTVALAVLGGLACSSGDGITAEELQASQGQVTADVSAEVQEVAASVAALQEELAQLQGYFVQRADGSVVLATATSVPAVTYSEYGFSIPFPATVSPIATGLEGGDAGDDSGSLLANSGGVSLLLVWQKLDPPLTPEESVSGAFEILQAATAANFRILGGGSDSLTIDGQSAAYGTFVANEGEGDTEGVGVIGGWVCGSTGRSYAMTVTGAEVEPVQDSFFYFADNFHCAP